jgi:ribosomal protein L37AE/L43A
MRQPLIWTIAGIAVLCTSVDAQNKYVGAKTCARCHNADAQRDAMHVWQASKHAEAFFDGALGG